MSISEIISSVELLENNDKYDRFITVPIREHNDYFTLGDVCIKKTDTVDKELNLLFLIRDVTIHSNFIELKFLKIFTFYSQKDWSSGRNKK